MPEYEAERQLHDQHCASGHTCQLLLRLGFRPFIVSGPIAAGTIAVYLNLHTGPTNGGVMPHRHQLVHRRTVGLPQQP